MYLCALCSLSTMLMNNKQLLSALTDLAGAVDGVLAALTAPITQCRRDRRAADSHYQINTPNGAPPAR